MSREYFQVSSSYMSMWNSYNQKIKKKKRKKYVGVLYDDEAAVHV